MILAPSILTVKEEERNNPTNAPIGPATTKPNPAANNLEIRPMIKRILVTDISSRVSYISKINFI